MLSLDTADHLCGVVRDTYIRRALKFWPKLAQANHIRALACGQMDTYDAASSPKAVRMSRASRERFVLRKTGRERGLWGPSAADLGWGYGRTFRVPGWARGSGSGSSGVGDPPGGLARRVLSLDTADHLSGVVRDTYVRRALKFQALRICTAFALEAVSYLSIWPKG